MNAQAARLILGPSLRYLLFSINEPVFLVSEFSLRYLLIFEDQTLGLDFISRYQKKNSQMRFCDNSETRR